MPAPPRPASARLPGLDTLRALAILAVMVFHLQNQLPAVLEPIGHLGWVGVDLFFVLSGYLIGTQLLRPYARGTRPSLADFYRRRLFRILPAYLVVLLLYLTWPAFRERPGLAPAWQFLTFTLNYTIDYAHNQAFSHAWSLCVEEHFYLLLPLALLLGMRRPSLRRTLVCLGTLVLAGIALRLAIYTHLVLPADDDAVGFRFLELLYYPTHARLDGLLAGVALALLQLFRPASAARLARHGHALALTGVALLAIALWLSHNRYDFDQPLAPWSNAIGGPLLALSFTLLTAAALTPTSFLGRARIPGARTLALLSFSLYLTHKQMAHLSNLLVPSLATRRDLLTVAAYTASCLAGATLLYLTVERPFIRLREHLDHRRHTPTPAETDHDLLTDPAL